MNGAGRMDVGPGDAIRCALGLLLPSWLYVAGLITGASAAFGAWSSGTNSFGAFAGFAFAAGVEVLRRMVLISRPSGGRSATASLRVMTGALPILGLASTGVLASDLASGCPHADCAGEARVAVWLWLALCILCLATTPMLLRVRRSPWLQPRVG